MFENVLHQKESVGRNRPRKKRDEQLVCETVLVKSRRRLIGPGRPNRSGRTHGAVSSQVRILLLMFHLNAFVRSRALRSSIDGIDELALLSNTIPEEKFREWDMVRIT
jgi:hypothetical protein